MFLVPQLYFAVGLFLHEDFHLLFLVHPFLSLAPNIPIAILLGYLENLFLSFQWKHPKTSCLLGGTEALLLKTSLHSACLRTFSLICFLHPFPFSKCPLIRKHFSLIARGMSLFDLHYLQRRGLMLLQLRLSALGPCLSHVPRFYQ